MKKVLPQVHEKDIHQTIFWGMLGAIIFSIMLYIFLMHGTINNVVTAKDYDRTSREVKTELLVIEQEYLNKTKDFNVEFAAEHNLFALDSNTFDFVKVGGGDSLTLRSDE